MAITTNNSTSVNARLRRFACILFPSYGFLDWRGPLMLSVPRDMRPTRPYHGILCDNYTQECLPEPFPGFNNSANFAGASRKSGFQQPAAEICETFGLCLLIAHVAD
jgi:hypothetical protein